MSKRSTRRSYRRPSQRVTSAKRYQRRLVLRRPVSLSPLLSMYEDRRQFHPAGPLHRPVSAFVRSATIRKVPVVNQVNRMVAFTRAMPVFADSSKVFVCIRRKARREVLHALFGRLGSGVSRMRRKSGVSDVRC